MSRPDDVRALPKFASTASVGRLVGYHIQPGGHGGGEYEVFPLDRFKDYDVDLLRKLNELIPVRTMEARFAHEVYKFPMKDLNDTATRSLRPKTVIRPADEFEHIGDDEPGDADDPRYAVGADAAPEPAAEQAPVASIASVPGGGATSRS